MHCFMELVLFFCVLIAMAKTVVYVETGRNTGTILSGVLQRSHLSKAKRCHRFGSM